jgi:hypothetical protein
MLTKAQQKIATDYIASPGLAKAEVQLGKELGRAMQAIPCNWKFSRDGGAVGAITLKDENGDPVKLPAGFVVWDSCILVKSQVTSSGLATLAFAANAANDIKTAEAVATFSANARVAGIPVGTAASSVLCTAERTPTLTVASFALTAGELDVFLIGFYQDRT